MIAITTIRMIVNYGSRLTFSDTYGSAANFALESASIVSRKVDCWRLNSPSLEAQLRIPDFSLEAAVVVVDIVFLNKNAVEDTEIWFENVCLKEKTLESRYIRRRKKPLMGRRDIFRFILFFFCFDCIISYARKAAISRTG